jgi:hypothetical protein
MDKRMQTVDMGVAVWEASVKCWPYHTCQLLHRKVQSIWSKVEQSRSDAEVDPQDLPSKYVCPDSCVPCPPAPWFPVSRN